MPKSFSWSYSKLKNFEVCPKRHFHVDVRKDIREGESEQLTWGNEVHKHLAARIGKGTPLPTGYEHYEVWASKVLNGSGSEVLVEQKLAITDAFTACSFFDGRAWYRAIVDVLKIHGDIALAIDWKTGKILEDGVQLALAAACIFAHHPKVQHIRTEFVWLKEGDDVTTRQDYSREQVVEIWRQTWPRIAALRRAYENNEFPATPNYLCRRYCPVTSCPHHGE